MSETKIDLNKLKEEIHTRKNEGVSVVEEHAVASGSNKWLNELVQSVKTGSDTETSKKIANVNRRANDMVVEGSGVKVKSNSNNDYMKHVNTPTHTNTTNNTLNERDDALFDKFNNMRPSGGLADAISDVSGVKSGGRHEQQQQQPMVNEQMITSKIDSHLNNNLTPLMEELMKNTLVEIYSVDRVKKVIKENPEIIENYLEENPKIVENIVINTIKKLQQRKAKK